MLTGRVDNIEQLNEIIEQLVVSYPDDMLVYRGQTHGYEPTPSASRTLDNSDQKRINRQLQSNWDHLAFHLLQDYSISTNPFYQLFGSMSILQHYGFESWFVDVTTDPMVGIWFARNKYFTQNIKVKPDPITGTGIKLHVNQSQATVAISNYESFKNDGFLYIYAVKPDSSSIFFLDKIFSPDALRPHRQKASALVDSMDGIKMNSLIVAKLDVSKDFEIPKYLTQLHLFPLPNEDKVYSELLSIPYVVTEEDFQNGSLVAKPELLKVPWYVNKGSIERIFLKTARVIIGQYASAYNNYNRTIIKLPIANGPNSLMIYLSTALK